MTTRRWPVHWRVDRLLVRDMSFQTVSGYVSTAMQVIRGVVLAGALGPAGLGVLALVALVASYAQYTDLGMGQAVTREIPIALGRGEQDSAGAWAWHGYVAKTVTAVIAGLCVLLWAVVIHPPYDGVMRFGLIIAGPIIVLQALAVIQQNVMLAKRQFGAAAVTNTVNAGLGLGLGVVAALTAGVEGVFVSQVIALAVAVLTGAVLGGPPRRHQLERSRLATLLRVGLPLAGLTLLGANLVWVDQLMVASLFSQRDLGLYTLVLYAGSAMYLLPTALAAVVSPRLIARYGDTGDPAAVAAHAWRPVDVLAVLLPWETVAVWILGPLAIRWLLPEYAPVITPLRLYAAGMFFLSLNLGVSSVLVAFDKHRFNLPIIGLCLLLNVGLDLVFVAVLGWGLWAIALGSVLTYLTYWMAHMTLVRHYFGSTMRRAILQNLGSGWTGLVLLAFIAVAAATGTIDESSAGFDVALVAAVAAATLVRWRQAARTLYTPREVSEP